MRAETDKEMEEDGARAPELKNAGGISRNRKR